MIWRRLLFGSLMIAALTGLVALDGWVSTRAVAESGLDTGMEGVRLEVLCGLPITLLVVGLVVLGTYELGAVCREGGHRPATHWAAFVGALLAVVPWVEMQERLRPTGSWIRLAEANVSLTVFLLAGGVLGTCLAILLRQRTDRAISDIATTLLAMTYLGLLGSFAVRVRCLQPGAGGAALVAFFILVVKSADIGAFFVGKFLGKRKLAPKLSPGKTIEGAVGAVLVAAGVSAAGMSLWAGGIERLGPVPLSFAQALWFGVVMAIGGHLGDLVESAMKRDAGMKDSGQVVPAFGGLLDIIDSPVFTAPIAWWLLTRWSPMG